MKTKTIILLILVTFTACKSRSRLNTDEQKLTTQIIQEEEEKGVQKNERAATTGIDGESEVIRLNEVRSVDTNYPPLVIDIAGSLDNLENLKLSEVASNIRYVRMENVPDSTLPTNMKYRYYLTDKNIVALNLYGIHLFTKEGAFIKTIVQNDLTGITLDEKRVYIMIRYDHTKIGGGASVWGKGDKFYYEYSNNITGQKYIMEYDCSLNNTNINLQLEVENPDKIIGQGEVLVDLNHENTVAPKKSSSNGMMAMSPEYYYQTGTVFSDSDGNYIKGLRNEKMLGIFSTKGDTLSTFTRLEQIENYTKSVSRGTDYGTRYNLGENMFYRPNFNDTVFQVVPPNRLIPRYVLNLGQYKTSKAEGMDPDLSLKNKIIPMKWAETQKHIFLTFTKDSYDCPRNRRDKSVKVFHAVFNKQNQRLKIIDSDPTNYSPNILENDIDGGLPVWPLSYQISNDFKMLIPLKGKELKKHVKSTLFTASNVDAGKKNELKRFSNSLKDDDDILMIIE